MLARDEGDLGLMELMLARRRRSRIPCPTNCGSSTSILAASERRRAPLNIRSNRGVIPKPARLFGIYLVQHAGERCQGQRPVLRLRLSPTPLCRVSSLISACSVGMGWMPCLEGIANTGKPSYPEWLVCEAFRCEAPLPLFLVQPYPVRQDAVRLIREKVHDVLVSGLQGSSPCNWHQRQRYGYPPGEALRVEPALALRKNTSGPGY